MKKISAIAFILAACGLSFTARAELVNGIKAIVHDSVVTLEEVEVYTTPVREELQRQFRTQPDAYEKKLNAALSETLEQRLERQLILHEFSTAGYNLPETVIEDEVQRQIRNRARDRATLTKTLQAQGMTYEKFRQRVRDEFIISQMRYKNISGEILVSPHKIETYYLAHTDDFKIQDEVKLRMIVLNVTPVSDAEQTRKLAGEILGKIKDGAAFTEMAAIYSPGRGQDAEWWQKSALRKELADVAFTLKPGQTSGVVETPGADYLLLVEEIRPAHVKALSEVRDEIEKTMLTLERERLQKEWIERLKKKTFVRYF